jgi:hypothetical protein
MLNHDYPSTFFQCFPSALRCRRTGIELGHIETEEVDVTDDQQPQQRRVVPWTCGEIPSGNSNMCQNETANHVWIERQEAFIQFKNCYIYMYIYIYVFIYIYYDDI